MERAGESPIQQAAWVTYALACLCALGFAYSQMEALDTDSVVEAQLASAEAFFRARPYLVLPAELEGRIAPATATQLARQHERKRRRLAFGPQPARLTALEQSELDQMAARVTARVKRLPAQRYGVRAGESDPAKFFEHLLLHGSAAHLAVSLVLLLLLGRPLELACGSLCAFGLFAVSAAGSAASFVLQQPGTPEPLIGTSGLLAGLVGAFAVRFAGEPRPRASFALVPVACLALVLPPWFGLEWSIARGVNAVPPVAGGWNPSFWALLGGFCAGSLAALALKLLRLDGGGRTPAGLAARRAEAERSSVETELERALQERASGRLDDARRRLEKILGRDPEHRVAVTSFWEVCNELGQAGRAAPLLLDVIREDVRAGANESAVARWMELARCGLDGDAEPALLLRLAPLLCEVGEAAAAARVLRHALERADGAGATAVASRVARDAAAIDPDLAADAAWRGLASTEIGIDERQALEGVLAQVTPHLRAESARHSAGQEYQPPLLQPVRTASAPDDEDTAPQGIELDPEMGRDLECVAAVPAAFDAEGVVIEADGARKRVRYDRIQAVAVAAVEGLSDKPVIVIDLVLNWMSLSAEPLRVIRLRSDHFDPRVFVEGKRDALDAVREFARRLVDATGAMPLPDLQSVSGVPFAGFKTLSAYQRSVLLIDGED